MKKIYNLTVAVIVLLCFISCGQVAEKELDLSQMKAICEMATKETYYHNVAKITNDQPTGFLGIGNQYEHYWIEYEAIVKVGINAALVSFEVVDNNIKITLPEAEVLSTNLINDSINTIFDKQSIKIDAKELNDVRSKSEKDLEETVANDKALLTSARQRAQNLLETFITNFGEAIGQEYSITWVYLDKDGNTLDSTAAPVDPQPVTNTVSE